MHTDRPAKSLMVSGRLEEMKKQEMPKLLPKGMELFLKIDGSKLMIQQGRERAGEIESIVLTRAICENYLGEKVVSPAARSSIWTRMEALKQA